MSANNNQLELVESILGRCFKNLNIQNGHISVDSPDTTGDGYVGTMLFVKVKHDDEVHDLVIKMSPQCKERRSFMDLTQVFEREIHFYTALYPEITEYQKEKAGRVLFSSVARCYGTYFGDNVEALVFEDLKVSGYRLWNRKVPMDECHISLVLEEYGKLHATSLAMCHRDLERFRTLTKNIHNDVFANIIRQTQCISIFDDRFARIEEQLESQGRDEDAKRIKRLRKEIPDIVFRYANPSDGHSVIMHGDCWCNNMMFKYEEGSPKPMKMRFLDFQISRLGSPLMDFSYFFYTCAPKQVLDDVEKYLNIYHNSIAKSLKELGCDPEKVFPFTLMKSHWKKYSKYGLVLSATFIRSFICDKDEAPNLTSDQFFVDFAKPIRNEEELNRRITNLVTHFLENNLI